MEKKEPLNVDRNDKEKLKIRGAETIQQPSTNGAPQNFKALNKTTGGGGAEASHGQVFHLNAAMLLLFNLKEKSQSELDFEYNIWLEKEGYGKFDDIVLQYKRSEGKRTQICVQCKHGKEKINPDGTRDVNNVTAMEFLSNKNKSFSLVEYIKSFEEIHIKNIDCETYFVLLSNRAYVNDKDSKYTFFEREENVDLSQFISLDMFGNASFKIKYNDELGDYLLQQITLKNEKDINLFQKTIKEFCDKFIYICDNRDFDIALGEKIASQCRNNKENMMNLKARLYYLVSQMYQHKMDPTKNDIINEFNGRHIYFQIPSSCNQFTGRTDEIQIIKEALDCEKKGHIFDLIITGMAGMGKTQLFRKYVDEYMQHYKHVIWINAESKDSLENSFVELARSCNLINNDCKEDISTVVNTIYSYFRENTLFVFDNTSNLLLTKNVKREFLYLPHYDRYKSNKYVIISQEQKWTANNPTITLDRFTADDAFMYLDASIECSKEDKVKLASKFQCWPLALCLAVSYIKLEVENSFGRKNFSDVIETLQVENKKLLEHLPENHEMEPYTECLKSLWLLIRNKLKEENKLCPQILNILAFSHPDNFPIELLKLDGINESEVNVAVKTLQQNSIVIVTKYKISIHRTLQSVIKSSIASDINIFESTLLNSNLCFHNYLKSMNAFEGKKSLGNIHMVTFLQHICKSEIDPKKYIFMANLLLKKIINSEDLRGYCETNGIFDLILETAQEKLGANNEDTLCILFRKANMLREVGKFVDSLHIFNELIGRYTELFHKNHVYTLASLEGKASNLNAMGKCEDALSICYHVIEIRKEQHGEYHTETLTCMELSALVLFQLGNFDEALRILNHVIDIETQICGTCHPMTLSTFQNGASILNRIGKYHEALSICNTVIEIEKEMYGENDHPSILTSMNNKASLLKKLGKYSDALFICNHVIEILSEIVGENHPSTLGCMHNKASILHHMGKYDDALRIYDHVIETETKTFGGHSPTILHSLNNKALVLRHMGKYAEALHIFNRVIEIQTELFDENHPDNITTMQNKASVLFHLEKYNEALCTFNHVIEKTREMFGEEHHETIKSLRNKAVVLCHLGNHFDALSILNYCIEMLTEIFDDSHPETIASLHNKAALLVLLGELDEALNIFNRVIEKRTEIFGATHSDTIKSKNYRDEVLKLLQKNQTH